MLWSFTLALAAPVPVAIQGTLTDANGAPLSGAHAITVQVYPASAPGSAASATHTVHFQDGAFTATIDVEPSLLSAADLALSVTWGGVTSDAVAVAWAPRAGWAASAGDASKLGAVDASAFYRSPTGVPWADVQGRPAAIVSEITLRDYIQANAYDSLSDLTTAIGSTYLTPSQAAATYFDSLSDLTGALGTTYLTPSQAAATYLDTVGDLTALLDGVYAGRSSPTITGDAA